MKAGAAARAVGTRSIALVAAATLLGVLLVAAVRETSISRGAIAAADAAASRSEWPEAVARAREAAEALVPGTPWRDQGFRRLDAIGRDALARGDDRVALLAYGAMRTAAIETEAAWSDSARWQATGEDGLAHVAASRRDPAVVPVSADEMLEALHRTDRPSKTAVAILSVSALAVLGGLAGILLDLASIRARRACQAVAAAGFVGYAIVLLSR
jgi:hypothetical protein